MSGVRVVQPDGTITREPFERLGVEAVVSPETFRRADKEKAPYVTPKCPPVIQRAVMVEYTVERTKNGKPKGITSSHELPAGAARMVKTIDGLPGWGMLVSHAIGWDMAANGGQAMTPEWTVTDEGKRKKIGEHAAPPVESIFVRAYALGTGGLIMLAGLWYGTTWERGHVIFRPNLVLHEVGWQPSKVTRDAPDRRLTLSEWIDRAADLDVVAPDHGGAHDLAAIRYR